MARASGIVVRMGTQRHELFDAYDDVDVPWGEPVGEFACSSAVPLLAIIVCGKRITHIATGKRGVRAGTGVRRLNLSDVQRLSHPMLIASVVRRLPGRVKPWVTKRLRNRGLLSPAAFISTVDVLIHLAPELRERLSRFGQDRQDRIDQLSERTKDALGQQKAAVTTALMLSGLPRESLKYWDPGETAHPSSFLDGLPTARLREDPMVINDLNYLPGHEHVGRHMSGAAMFEGEKSRLTVILANRQPLEEQLGVDLIYFNETFRSFVMVQYKAMEREDDESVFRLPNQQLEEEIGRMEEVLQRLDGIPAANTPLNYRLYESPFFLKLCPRIVFNPDDSALVPGMYISLDYWNLVTTDPATTGPRGGRVVTYKNVGRYFDNSEFTMLVSKSWVGTTEEQSELLEDVIRRTIASGKAVAIGIKTEHQPEAAPGAEGEPLVPDADEEWRER